jgi:hypothetical protein
MLEYRRTSEANWAERVKPVHKSSKDRMDFLIMIKCIKEKGGTQRRAQLHPFQRVDNEFFILVTIK